MKQVSFSQIIGNQGIFVDGDWVESKDQDPNGDVRLIQLADIGDGYFTNKSKRYLTSEKAKELRCTFLKPGDLLIARMPDPLGRACIFPEIEMPCVTVVDVCIVRPDKNIVLSRWLKLLVNSPEFRENINKYITGTTRERISRGNLERLKFDVPSLEEQKRIIEILDEADALRQKRRQAVNLLDDYMRSMFLKMFGDPVKNPKGLKIKSIKEIGVVKTGTTPPSSNEGMFEGGNIPFITPGDLNNGHTKRFLTEVGLSKSRFVRKGATMVCCIGATIGKIGMAQELSGFNQQINAIEWNQNLIKDYFGYFLMKFMKKTIISRGISTTLPILKKSEFEKIKIPVPTIRFQEDFEIIYIKQESLKQKMLTQSAELENQFQALMQKAFKGAL